MRKKLIWAIAVVMAVLIIDQIIKIWVKTSFFYNEEREFLGILNLHFMENEGMAFGSSFGGATGKLILSLFRIIAVGFIAWYLWSLIKRGAKLGLIVAISLVLSGALGNIVDSLWYGSAFDYSCPTQARINNELCKNDYMEPKCQYCYGERGFKPFKAKFMSGKKGYAAPLYGRVVDMFEFPAKWPKWMPYVGGSQIFPAVFNFADAAISIGVIMLLLFQRRFFSAEERAQYNPFVKRKQEKKALQEINAEEE